MRFPFICSLASCASLTLEKLINPNPRLCWDLSVTITQLSMRPYLLKISSKSFSRVSILIPNTPRVLFFGGSCRLPVCFRSPLSLLLLLSSLRLSRSCLSLSLRSLFCSGDLLRDLDTDRSRRAAGDPDRERLRERDCDLDDIFSVRFLFLILSNG